MGIHRKLKPTGSERLIWGEGDGSTMPVFPTEFGKLGGLICWENYMPLARMAMYGQELETIEELADEPDIMCQGGSVIVDPFGDVLAGPLWGKEGIIYADLDLEKITRAKVDFDITGHYARPDIFKLIVNKEPQSSVSFV